MHRFRTAAALLAALPLATVVFAAPAGATTTGTTQGCTPGFWKNHTSQWLESANVRIPTTTRLDAVAGASGQRGLTLFTATAKTGYADTTMLQALSFDGGKGVDGAERILLRAAVASWLNSAHEGVAYPLRRHSPGGTAARVNTALLSQDRESMIALAAQLDTANNLGCPL